MSDEPRPPSPEEIGLFAFQVWSYKQGEMVSLLIHLGDRLGLYRAMRGAGTLGAGELAQRTGLDERWVLEWLRGQGAAGLLTWHDDDRFELTDAAAAVLADEHGSLFFAAGAFGTPPAPDFVDDLAEAFRTGLGLPYDRQGPAGAHRTERMLGPWTRLALVPRILPALEGVEAKLDAGGMIADIGCGSGVAIVALARRFRRSHVHGFDISRYAIERARQLVAEAELDNVTLHLAGAEVLPSEATFDFVLTLDCLHDMTRPTETLAAVRRSIKSDGTWLIKDIRCTPRAKDNLANPMAAMMYGFSIASCMSSALSEPDGAGLGTLGLHPELLARLCTEAGFSHFQVQDFDEPANLYYEVRV
ncbi:MAG TPA: class I SAM-dependent methyltransferase [Acidimicrobiales bacterium]|nr:class I SAM-dependent methyltransferase [Acidimicrobiales bacterium]